MQTLYENLTISSHRVPLENESLSNKQPEDETLRQLILRTVQEKKPENVEELTNLIQEKSPSTSKQKIIDNIIHLQSEGKIALREQVSPVPSSLPSYLYTNRAYWYWTTIVLAILTTILVFTIPEDAYPIVYARYVLGSIFVLWLPGYTFIKALFPTTVLIKTSSTELDNIERIALSIGMSIALVPIVGLLLNYTPWGIRLTPITLSLLALTLTFATAAIVREHKASLKQNISNKKGI